MHAVAAARSWFVAVGRHKRRRQVVEAVDVQPTVIAIGVAGRLGVVAVDCTTGAVAVTGTELSHPVA